MNSVIKKKYVVFTPTTDPDFYGYLFGYFTTMNNARKLVKETDNKSYVFNYWYTENTKYKMRLNIPLDKYYKTIKINHYHEIYEKDEDHVLITLDDEIEYTQINVIKQGNEKDDKQEGKQGDKQDNRQWNKQWNKLEHIIII